MRQILVGSALAAALFALTACDSVPYSRQTQGAALGAAAGGVAGHAISGGSALGTIGGAAVGGVVGSEVGKRQDQRR
ncbi:MAG TPA: glycine zipper 2TM domain-containing protein [Burkholderiales bacterium]|nr:glycine zipper 2TM domain-containing protein [Burkholderiales bacterium]